MQGRKRRSCIQRDEGFVKNCLRIVCGPTETVEESCRDQCSSWRSLLLLRRVAPKQREREHHHLLRVEEVKEAAEAEVEERHARTFFVRGLVNIAKLGRVSWIVDA